MPPSTPAPAPTCDHCGYDLTGIAPGHAAFPCFILCPECGKRTDTSTVPPPRAPWWRVPLAIAAGTGTTAIIVLSVHAIVLHALASGPVHAKSSFLTLVSAIALGAAVSLAIVWRDRIAALEWERRTLGLRRRPPWPLLVDLMMYCIVNTSLLIAIPYAITKLL